VTDHNIVVGFVDNSIYDFDDLNEAPPTYPGGTQPIVEAERIIAILGLLIFN
jgi:hypothetical protein